MIREKIAPEWEIERNCVDSDNVISFGAKVDRGLQETVLLEVEFQRGAVYRYHDVPRSVYLDFCAATESFGRFLNANIKGIYRCTKVDTVTGLDVDLTDKPASASSREFLETLLKRGHYVSGHRGERAGAGLFGIAQHAKAEWDRNDPPFVSSWLAGLTQAQASAAIDYLKGATR